MDKKKSSSESNRAAQVEQVQTKSELKVEHAITRQFLKKFNMRISI